MLIREVLGRRAFGCLCTVLFEYRMLPSLVCAGSSVVSPPPWLALGERKSEAKGYTYTVPHMVTRCHR